MRAVDLIQKKRDGQELTSNEIKWLVEGYVAGTIPDYQMSAFAMAVYFKGMTTREISALFDNLMNNLFARSNRRIGNNMVKFPFNLFIDIGLENRRLNFISFSILSR